MGRKRKDLPGNLGSQAGQAGKKLIALLVRWDEELRNQLMLCPVMAIEQ